jgi:hypothetical protein
MKFEEGESFLLPRYYLRKRCGRRIKKQKKMGWRNERKKLSRAIDSGIALGPVYHGAFRKSYKIQIRRLKSKIRNHNKEITFSQLGPFNFERAVVGLVRGMELRWSSSLRWKVACNENNH